MHKFSFFFLFSTGGHTYDSAENWWITRWKFLLNNCCLTYRLNYNVNAFGFEFITWFSLSFSPGGGRSPLLFVPRGSDTTRIIVHARPAARRRDIYVRGTAPHDEARRCASSQSSHHVTPSQRDRDKSSQRDILYNPHRAPMKSYAEILIFFFQPMSYQLSFS